MSELKTLVREPADIEIDGRKFEACFKYTAVESECRIPIVRCGDLWLEEKDAIELVNYLKHFIAWANDEKRKK